MEAAAYRLNLMVLTEKGNGKEKISIYLSIYLSIYIYIVNPFKKAKVLCLSLIFNALKLAKISPSCSK
jgi:hypothetical protein